MLKEALSLLYNFLTYEIRILKSMVEAGFKKGSALIGCFEDDVMINMSA